MPKGMWLSCSPAATNLGDGRINMRRFKAGRLGLPLGLGNQIVTAGTDTATHRGASGRFCKVMREKPTKNSLVTGGVHITD